MAKQKNKNKKYYKKSYSMVQLLLVALFFGVIGGLFTWVTLAAPSSHGGKTNGSITLNLPPSSDKNSDGQPNWGDTVSFTLSTTISQPFVNLQCFQNGTRVENGWIGYFPESLDYPNKDFGLGSGAWQSGAANCTAYLDYATGHSGKNQFATVASTSFNVNP